MNSQLYDGTRLAEAPLDIENLAENLTDYSVDAIKSVAGAGFILENLEYDAEIHTKIEL